MSEAPKRCEECDCEHGGYDCNWIMSPVTGKEHARLMAEKNAEIARMRKARTEWNLARQPYLGVHNVQADAGYSRHLDRLADAESALSRLCATLGDSHD